MFHTKNIYYTCKKCVHTLQNPTEQEDIDEFMSRHSGHDLEISTVNYLFDLGYNDLKKADEFLAVAKSLGAIVADIRFQPDTRNPEFSRKHLAEILGEDYIHIGELGNANYKGTGETKLADIETGMAKLHTLLEIKPVIMICACWKRNDCHRLQVGYEYSKRHGMSSVAITRKDAREIVAEFKKANDPQMPLL